MQYTVLSNVLKMDIIFNDHTLKLDHQEHPTEIVWSLEGEDRSLTHTEATLLKQYLDSKNNFSKNELIETNDWEVIDLMTEDPEKILYIHLSNCLDLSDYNFSFKIIGEYKKIV